MKTTVLLVICLVVFASLEGCWAAECLVGWYNIDERCIRNFSSRFRRSSCVIAGHKIRKLSGFDEICIHKRSLFESVKKTIEDAEALQTTKAPGEKADTSGFGNPGFGR